MTRIAVVGCGKMAVDCIKIISATPGADLRLVIANPPSGTWTGAVMRHCTSEGIAVIRTTDVNAPEVLERLKAAKVDFIFSINNFHILRPAFLALAKDATVNFHNGPLPRYGGLNVCSWAILNGESRHGFTWHFVDKGIDTGDIISVTEIDIKPNETARSLITRTITGGIKTFPEVFKSVLAGTATRIKQDKAKASYYSRKDTPNGGLVDFNWSFETFDRFIRALTFHPIPNTFVHAHSSVRGRRFCIEGIERTERSSLPSYGENGEVLRIKEGRVEVRIADAVIGLTEVLDDAMNAMTIRDFLHFYGIRVGDRLGT